MKTLIALLALLPSAAIAADMPVKAPAAPAVVSWSGFYIGVNGAGAQLNNKFDSNILLLPGTGNLKPSGGMAGLTVGLGTYSGSAYVGVEADADYDFTKNNVTCVAIANCQMKSGLFFTQRAIIGANLSSITNTYTTLVKNPQGFVVPSTAWAGQLMPYGTVGVAERRLKACVTMDTASDCGSQWLVGLAVGGGVRLPIASTISFDVSYLFVNWNKSFSPTPTITPFTTFKAVDEQILKAALIDHF